MTGMQQKRRMRKSNDEKKYVENIAGEREEKEHEKRTNQTGICGSGKTDDAQIQFLYQLLACLRVGRRHLPSGGSDPPDCGAPVSYEPGKCADHGQHQSHTLERHPDRSPVVCAAGKMVRGGNPGADHRICQLCGVTGDRVPVRGTGFRHRRQDFYHRRTGDPVWCFHELGGRVPLLAAEMVGMVVRIWESGCGCSGPFSCGKIEEAKAGERSCLTK